MFVVRVGFLATIQIFKTFLCNFQEARPMKHSATSALNMEEVNTGQVRQWKACKSDRSIK